MKYVPRKLAETRNQFVPYPAMDRLGCVVDAVSGIISVLCFGVFVVPFVFFTEYEVCDLYDGRVVPLASNRCIVDSLYGRGLVVGFGAKPSCPAQLTPRYQDEVSYIPSCSGLVTGMLADCWLINPDASTRAGVSSDVNGHVLASRVVEEKGKTWAWMTLVVYN
ncbi:hypothetical protein LY78DRAFT_378631 [Colletotrichum sublineola]|nr:hypothetical protein LY78DRAFT_378631 [Colletotrichum sublineola]